MGLALVLENTCSYVFSTVAEEYLLPERLCSIRAAARSRVEPELWIERHRLYRDCS